MKMDDSITINLKVPLSELGTPKVRAILKLIEEYKKGEKGAESSPPEPPTFASFAEEVGKVVNESLRGPGTPDPARLMTYLASQLATGSVPPMVALMLKTFLSNTCSKTTESSCNSKPDVTPVDNSTAFERKVNEVFGGLTKDHFSALSNIGQPNKSAAEILSGVLQLAQNITNSSVQTHESKTVGNQFSCDWLLQYGVPADLVSRINRGINLTLSLKTDDEVKIFVTFADKLKDIYFSNISLVQKINISDLARAVEVSPAILVQFSLKEIQTLRGKSLDLEAAIDEFARYTFWDLIIPLANCI